LLLMFGARALAGFPGRPVLAVVRLPILNAFRSPLLPFRILIFQTRRTWDVIRRAGWVVKRKDGRLVNMLENSEGVGRNADLLSWTKPGGDKRSSDIRTMPARRGKKSGNMVSVPGFPVPGTFFGSGTQTAPTSALPRSTNVWIPRQRKESAMTYQMIVTNTPDMSAAKRTNPRLNITQASPSIPAQIGAKLNLHIRETTSRLGE